MKPERLLTDTGGDVDLMLEIPQSINVEERLRLSLDDMVPESKGDSKLKPRKLASEKGEDVEGGRLVKELYQASERGDEAVVRLLLKKNAYVNVDGGRYGNALQAASACGHDAVVRLLLEKNADVNAAHHFSRRILLRFADNYRRTPLSWAAENGHVDVVKLLLKANANIETVDNFEGRTPLCWAAMNGHVDVVKLLLNANANIETADKSGRTPLSWAAEKGHVDVVKLLLNANANIETADNYGRKLAEIQTIPTSIADGVNSLDENVDYELWIIEQLRHRATEKLNEKNYAEAKSKLEDVLKRSERKYGNIYEWKDDIIRKLALCQCYMHRWTEAEEIIATEFSGRDEVLRILAKEYCDEGRTNEALRILERKFEGRDEMIARIVEDLCLKKKWETAVKFARVDFVGRERPLEIVAAGCQQSSMWVHAANIWREVLNCKIARQASTAETLHALANAHLHQKSLSEAGDWCQDAIKKRIATVGKAHILFYHTMNLLARIHLAEGNPEEAKAVRLLVPEEFLNGSCGEIMSD